MIFINYERNNFYKIYYYFIKIVYKVRNIDIDKSLLYNKFKIKLWEFLFTEIWNLMKMKPRLTYYLAQPLLKKPLSKYSEIKKMIFNLEIKKTPIV